MLASRCNHFVPEGALCAVEREKQSEVIKKQAEMLDRAMDSIKRLADLQLESTHQFVVDELMKLRPVSKWLM